MTYKIPIKIYYKHKGGNQTLQYLYKSSCEEDTFIIEYDGRYFYKFDTKFDRASFQGYLFKDRDMDSKIIKSKKRKMFVIANMVFETKEEAIIWKLRFQGKMDDDFFIENS